MSAKKLSDSFRTWVEIDAKAAQRNYKIFRSIAGKNVQLWAVVKSNAYGHGLFAFSKLMDRFGIDGFCVDSIVEGTALRKAGMKKPILVLGPTLPARYSEAAKHNITVSIASSESLKALARAKNLKQVPNFHLKIDTGMHRQGFYVEDLPHVMRLLNVSKPSVKKRLTGVFTHFASAKDINYPTYTDIQFEKFEQAIIFLEKNGYNTLIKHSAATGGALLNKKYHLNAVRIGIGMYGLWPSKELEVQLGDRMQLHPVLSWRAVISEVKPLKKGDYVGYDLTERAAKDMMMAVLPIGYWHGLPRSLSGVGTVLVNGKRARILGRVSMDLTVVGLSGSAKAGDIATLIGKAKKEEITASNIAQQAGTSPYELITRLNPLMERVIIE